MYYVIIMDRKNAKVIGFHNLGRTPIRTAKLKVTTRLRKYGYAPKFRDNAWTIKRDHPVWRLRRTLQRKYMHVGTRREITAYLISSKGYTNPQDLQGMPDLLEGNTNEIRFEENNEDTKIE